MTAKKYLALMVVLAAALLATSPAALAGEKLKIVMLGDSLTAGCDWQARLAQAEVVNQGVCGDSTWSVMTRLNQVVEARPDLIFLQLGINDFGKKPLPEAILERHQKIWREMREKLPQAKLYVVSLLPVSAKRYPRWGKPVVQLNLLLREAAEKNGLIYIDVYSRMSDQNGSLFKNFTYDGLHLLPKAYDQWLEAVKPYIDEALVVKGKRDDERQADHNAG